MDLESLNLRDKRNRFQVNRVDSSVTAGNHPPLNEHAATLVGYKEYSRGNGTTGDGDYNGGGSAGAQRHSFSANMEHIPQHNSYHGTIGNQYNNSSSYDTKYAKSFRHFTREALPRLDNYRNMMSIQAAYRPTLDELHDITLHQEKASVAATAAAPKGAPADDLSSKFGWIKGVFVRCLLNIWGVMLFLRLSWVVGQAGIAQALLIILSTTVVTSISSLSMAAIATNGEIKGGGTYYMISRSLGPEFGASIGLIFALANAIAVAMYTVGFSESMVDLLKSYGTYVVEDPTNSVRIIGAVAIICQTGIVCIGMSWESKAQVLLLFILLAAMLDFVIGSFIGPLSDEEISKGFVGFNGSVFVENLAPAYRYSEGTEQSFFSVFSIFFPAATGILAGANISGDLKDPQYSIPRGTLLAILVTTASYLAFALIVGATVVRDATGPLNLTDSGDVVLDGFRDCYSFNFTTDKTDYTCNEWGLMNSFQVMELVSAWGLLIYLGCFAATLSSALASFVSAPKVFQALCNDNIFPYLEFFGKGYGKSKEPVRGYVLTFIIALIFIVIGELNAIAPLISNFFLAAYALINFSTFHASLASPGFRPSFRYYNMWLSLVGAILCVAVMFLISWVTALLTFGVVLFLYMVVVYRKPDSNWGSSLQANTYKNALTSVQQLTSIHEHVKNFRPQILVLSALPSTRPILVDFAYLITKHLSLLVCGHVVKNNINNRVRVGLRQKSQAWFQARKMKAFYCSVDDCTFEDGAKSLIQAYGVGKLRPNILMMGFKQNWGTCERSELLEYFNVIHKALDSHLSVTVLRIDGGFDYSKKIVFGEDQPTSTSPNNQGELGKNKASSDESLARNNSNQSFSQMSHASSGELNPSLNPTASQSKSTLSRNGSAVTSMYRGIDGNELSKELIDSVTRFQKKTKHGSIDVWWLYDDGGLTLLLPYIISTRSSWSSCKLRVFAFANKKDEFDAEQRSMAGLLAKFRIDYSDLILIPDVNKKPQPSTVAFFEGLIAGFRQDFPDDDDKSELLVNDAELLAMKDKSNRHMRLRELLLENSKNASMVVMTLPMPRKGVVSAPLYMAWLELLTRDMPPFLLVRGNQTSVLTFYS